MSLDFKRPQIYFKNQNPVKCSNVPLLSWSIFKRYVPEILPVVEEFPVILHCTLTLLKPGHLGFICFQDRLGLNYSVYLKPH